QDIRTSPSWEPRTFHPRPPSQRYPSLTSVLQPEQSHLGSWLLRREEGGRQAEGGGETWEFPTMHLCRLHEDGEQGGGRGPSMADLVSWCCPGLQVPAGKILDDQKKILFIFDGFEALGFSLVQPEAELSSDPREVKPLELTLMSLLKKTLLPKASLLITMRPTALGSLRQCLKGENYVEILGFSAARREEYFHRYFENSNKADVAFRFVKGNEILYSLCVIPIMSWTICTILEQELCGKKNLHECSKTTTGMMMFYLSQLLKHRDRDNPQVLQQFLLQLCSLAAEGIWKHKVLFEEKEIKDCGLDLPGLLPYFLNEKIPREGEDHESVYAFTHLHLQEFFAAMFYVLEDDGETISSLGRLEKNVNKLLESYNKSRKDLNVTVRFLFGLVSQKSIEYMDNTIGCRISPRAREELLEWLQGRHRGLSHPGQALKVSEMDTFHFLFEMNEKSFAQSALSHFTDLDLQDTRLTLYDQMALSFCIQHWAGLGSITLQGCSFHWRDPEAELDVSVNILPTTRATPGPALCAESGLNVPHPRGTGRRSCCICGAGSGSCPLPFVLIVAASSCMHLAVTNKDPAIPQISWAIHPQPTIPRDVSVVPVPTLNPQ
uniref:NACHT domain-containing protein n=1 Tax=Zonotrichia albicollis TaxID=44394 RepID=A0A8D2MBX6_ZONAL